MSDGVSLHQPEPEQPRESGPDAMWWISWYSDTAMSAFELHSPWWVSGYDADGNETVAPWPGSSRASPCPTSSSAGPVPPAGPADEDDSLFARAFQAEMARP